jgi:cell division protein FtsZ
MIHFEIPKNQSSIIKVIGVGGGGSNAVNYMHNLNIESVDFVVCNTDSQALALSPVANKIQLGPHLTSGLGAGANPEVGKQASEESIEDISKILKVNTRMAFITAGMGGGTGTGGAPVMAKICRELGILTVGIVTTPFTYEGRKRMKQAQEGIERMREHVDTILIISNDKLRQQFGNLPFTQAFAKADDILATATKCITDVINTTGQINVDFADVCTVMKNGGVAILGASQVAGEDRALHAVEEALNSPLLNDSDIRGAKWILLNITSSAGEFEHTMDEAEAIQAYVQQQAGENCDVILGMGHDPNLGDKIAVTVIATGFNHKEVVVDMPAAKSNEPERIVVKLNDGVNNIAPAAPSAPAQSAPEAPKASLEPTLVEMKTPSSLFDPKPAFPAQTEEKETFSLELKEDEAAPVATTTTSAPVASAAQAAPAPQATITPAPVAEQPANDIPMQVVIKEEQQPVMTPGGRMLTEFELEEKRRFEEQKKALEERADRLRMMSFNIKGGENKDDIENVPAYMRRNMNVDDTKQASTDTHYSGYSVGTNDDQNTGNGKGFLQTINTFLHGKKPD